MRCRSKDSEWWTKEIEKRIEWREYRSNLTIKGRRCEASKGDIDHQGKASSSKDKFHQRWTVLNIHLISIKKRLILIGYHNGIHERYNCTPWFVNLSLNLFPVSIHQLAQPYTSQCSLFLLLCLLNYLVYRVSHIIEDGSIFRCIFLLKLESPSLTWLLKEMYKNSKVGA